MSQLRNDYSYEELLRRALHSAVESVEPADDGLERIRAGLTTPHALPVAWVMAGYSEVARRMQGLLSAMTWRRPAEPSGPPQQRRLARLRLVAAVAAVTIVMAMGVSTLTPFGQQVLSEAGALLHSIGVGPVGPVGTAGPGAAGQGTGAAGGAGAGNGTQGQGQVAANCVSQTPVQATQPAGPSASPGPVTSPGPSASPTPVNGPSSDSPSPAPTSPSPSDSPSSASPAPTGGAGPASAGTASTAPAFAGLAVPGGPRAVGDATSQPSPGP